MELTIIRAMLVMALASQNVVVFAANKSNCRSTEVCIILDVSGTIYPSEFSQTKAFVKRVLNKISSSPGEVHASIVTFSTNAHIRIHCDEHKSTGRDTLEKAVLDLQHIGKMGFTNLRDGLIKGREALSTRGCGSDNAKQIMVVISDGCANRGNGGIRGILDEASEIRKDGIEIIALGVGKKINLDVLKNMTENASLVVESNRLNERVFEQATEILSSEKCKTAEVPLRICKCNTPSYWRKQSWTPMDASVISKQFQGNCYLEKIDNAARKNREELKLHAEYKGKNALCIRSLKSFMTREKLAGSIEVDRILGTYEKCIKDECFMDRIASVLRQREIFLNGEWNECQKWDKRKI